jgi:hypothetical protein
MQTETERYLRWISSVLQHTLFTFTLIMDKDEHYKLDNGQVTSCK